MLIKHVKISSERQLCDPISSEMFSFVIIGYYSVYLKCTFMDFGFSNILFLVTTTTYYYVCNCHLEFSKYFETDLHLIFRTKTAHDNDFLNIKLFMPVNLYTTMDMEYINNIITALSNFSLGNQQSVPTVSNMLLSVKMEIIIFGLQHQHFIH